MNFDIDGIGFRAITQEDQQFLYRVYASTRADEMSAVPWTEQQKTDFLRMQFDAQHAYYQEHFEQANFQLILDVEQPIGRLYFDCRDDEIRVIDIALLAEYRGQGHGGKIMQAIIDEGRDLSKPVRIHVEQNNPAMHLYERLGFKKLEDQGVYYLLEWTLN